MKKLKLSKLIASTLVIASLLALSPIGVSAEWKQNSTGWWYTDGNSWSTGWRQIDSKWYYFDSNGYLKTGWLLDDGNWYYFYGNGEMAFNTTIDGYYLNGSGVWSQNSSVNVSNTGSENGKGQIITFPDKNLEQAIRKTIGKPNGDLYKSDVESITKLISNNVGFNGSGMSEVQIKEILEKMYIKDISGIENLTNLQYLELGPIQVNDISAIKGLTNLQKLKLIGGKINNISAIEGLTNLKELSLITCQISDISAIKGLTNLQKLSLYGNKISDADKQSLKNAFPSIILSY